MTLLHSPPTRAVSLGLYNLLFALIFSGEALAEASPKKLNNHGGALETNMSIAQADQVNIRLERTNQTIVILNIVLILSYC
jgi:hypothetical protein